MKGRKRWLALLLAETLGVQTFWGMSSFAFAAEEDAQIEADSVDAEESESEEWIVSEDEIASEEIVGDEQDIYEEEFDSEKESDSLNESAAETGNCGKDGSNVTYNLDPDGTLTITGTGEMMDFSYGKGFRNTIKNEIKKVIIQNGVENIGEYFFYGCEYLKEVTMPNSVSTIGEGAFFSCERLDTIKMSSSISVIGKSAFNGCKGLKKNRNTQ
ncbi:MAG: leucine-rich repeat domain-containing protein [Lachnospiraceae bacterium]|nr:leucine-rich repeat domain-containing protein [Lachnospiraceae bacterium]